MRRENRPCCRPMPQRYSPCRYTGGPRGACGVERLQEIRGEGTPAVVLAVYGNRAFGTAVAQLAAFVAERGFVPVAAGALWANTSYSTPRHADRRRTSRYAGPRRSGRFPERASAKKLAHGETGPIDAAKLREPHTPLLSKLRFIRFVLGYRRRQKRTPAVLLPAGRRRTVHPMRPLRRALSHAGDRARRRTAHRPGTLHPLLCMRQRLRVRRTHVRDAFRRRSVAQLRPAQTTRNNYVI